MSAGRGIVERRKSFGSLSEFHKDLFARYKKGPGEKATVLIMDSSSNRDDPSTSFETKHRGQTGIRIEPVPCDQWCLELLEFDEKVQLTTLPSTKLRISLQKTVSVVRLPKVVHGKAMAFALRYWRQGGDKRDTRHLVINSFIGNSTINDIYITVHGSTHADTEWLAARPVVIPSLAHSSDARSSPPFRMKLRGLVDDICNSLDFTNDLDSELWVHHELSQHLPTILPGACIEWLDVGVDRRRIKLTYDGPLNSLRLLD